MTLQEAIGAYIDRFEEGPPIFGMSEDDAIDLIQQALDEGTPMKDGAELDIPGDARL